MKYSTNNVVASLTIHMGNMFRDAGYDLFWRSTGRTVERTDTSQASKGAITMTSYFPANPTYFVRLKDRATADTKQHEIVVPAFTLYSLTTPTKLGRYSMGGSVFFRERPIRIQGFVEDQFQHREMMDLIHTWLDRENVQSDKRLTIWDYDSNQTNPQPLDQLVEVPWSNVIGQEVYGDSGVTRYYIEATFVIHYVE